MYILAVEKLKPLNKKKKRYGLRAFLWGIAIASLFIVPFLIRDGGIYIYHGDFNIQIIPFYQLMHDAIRNGEFGWNWYTDLGTSLVGGYSYYSLGSPFFWVTLLFPTNAIPYLLGPLTILKFGLCSLTAYIYLKRYTREKNHAVFGGMLYAFSGFVIYNLVFHFMDVFVFFPLLLAALDSAVIDKKRGGFAVMVAVSAVVNYYFFVAEAVFCVVYWIVRLASKSYKSNFRETLFLIFEAVLGVGMSLFLLLPSVYSILGNSRVSSDSMTGWSYWLYDSVGMYAEILIGLFFPPELPGSSTYVPQFDSSWKSLNCWVPLFGMAGVFAIIFNKRKNKWIRAMYAVCAVLAFVPLFNSAFQMFTESGYLRWMFMLTLIMILGSLTALEDSSTKWKKAIRWNFVIVLVAGLAIGFTFDKNPATGVIAIGLMGTTSLFWMFFATAMLGIAITVLFISLYRNNRKAFNRCSYIIVSVAVIAGMSVSYLVNKSDGYNTTNLISQDLLNKMNTIDIDDIQNYRSNVVTVTNYADNEFTKEELSEKLKENPDYLSVNENFNMFMHIPGVSSFHSTVNSSVQRLVTGMGFDSTSTARTWNLKYSGLFSILSTKYLFDQKGNPVSPANDKKEMSIPGWKYYGEQNGYNVYENEYCLPMGITFDEFMTTSSFNEIPIENKHKALVKYLIISDMEDMFEMVAVNLGQGLSDSMTYTDEEFAQNVEDRRKIACYDFERDKKGFSAKIDTEENEEYVMFTVPYDNGWSATVNGEKVEIKLVDYAFMAVKVPANQTSEIRFDYHTPGFYYGLFVAGVSLLLLIIYLAAMKIQSMPAVEAEQKEGTDKEESDGDSSEKSENPAADGEEDITLFDIVRETEEQNLMHTYKRVNVVLESGSGSVGYDVEGKRYIDFTSGIGVNCLGFSDGLWLDAVEKQIETMQHMSNVYYNTTQIQLAELLCMKTGFNKVFFANSGAEANECAIKLARKYSGDKYGEQRNQIVTLENSFHGRTITTLAATGQDVFHKHFAPFTEGFSYAKANDISSVESKISDKTCAVMIELVQGEGGVMPLDKQFVTELAQLCREKDILLIVDEVQTGVGRTGKLYCYENYGIQPDIITSAKGLGGGLPLSVCMCTESLQDVLTYGTNGTTFGGNPVACAGSMHIIETISDEEFLDEVSEKGEYIREAVLAMDGVKSVRGMGLMIGIELDNNNAAEVQSKCAELGLLVLTAKNLIRLLPPLNIDYIDIDEGLAILAEAIKGTM